MNQPALPDPRLLLAVAALEERARAADSLNGLAFSIVNDPHPLLGFRQALAFDCSGPNWKLLAVSGLARPTEDSPYLVWLRQATEWLSSIPMQGPSAWLTASDNDLPVGIASGWEEWWPTGIWCVRIVGPDQQLLGMVVYLLDEQPNPIVVGQMLRLAGSWAYCWASLTKGKTNWRWRPTGRQFMILAIVAALLLLLPVRQTALAPAEIVALDATVVAAPLDGVVKKLHVRPNQVVKKGELLLSLDDTTLQNRLEVSLKGVAVADAELNASSQRSFDSVQGRNDIALLTGRAQERRAELAAIRAQLARIDVTAPRDGVAVFADPNDWLGKPVMTGERIMLLADPATPSILIHLPIADAISLDLGAAVKLYLSAHPLTSIEGKVIETSYQATTTPDGVSSYRLRATIDEPSPEVRLGLRGTAKIYGEWVVLGYYLLRRPLATVRAWSGF